MSKAALRLVYVVPEAEMQKQKSKHGAHWRELSRINIYSDIILNSFELLVNFWTETQNSHKQQNQNVMTISYCSSWLVARGYIHYPLLTSWKFREVILFLVLALSLLPPKLFVTHRHNPFIRYISFWRHVKITFSSCFQYPPVANSSTTDSFMWLLVLYKCFTWLLT